jgi:hypothetical protein
VGTFVSVQKAFFSEALNASFLLFLWLVTSLAPQLK